MYELDNPDSHQAIVYHEKLAKEWVKRILVDEMHPDIEVQISSSAMLEEPGIIIGIQLMFYLEDNEILSLIIEDSEYYDLYVQSESVRYKRDDEEDAMTNRIRQTLLDVTNAVS